MTRSPHRASRSLCFDRLSRVGGSTASRQLPVQWRCRAAADCRILGKYARWSKLSGFCGNRSLFLGIAACRCCIEPVRDLFERSRLQAALLIGSAIGLGQLSGLFSEAQAQTGSGLQQNKQEQELLRERLDRRQQDLQKPVPVREPARTPLVEPGPVDAGSLTPASRCVRDPARVNRISLVADQGTVLALDCQAPEAGFFITSSWSAAPVAGLRVSDRSIRASCVISSSRLCNDWRELRQMQRRLQEVERLGHSGESSGLTAQSVPDPSIGFALAEPIGEGSQRALTRPLQAPLPVGLQSVQDSIVRAIELNSELILGRELSQTALDVVSAWQRDVENVPTQVQPPSSVEERWERWLARRPERERPALRQARSLINLFNELSLDALGAEGYLGHPRVPDLRFAWGELRIARLSSLLSRFGELKADPDNSCRAPNGQQLSKTSTDRSQPPPIPWDWAKRAVVGDLRPGSLFRVDKLSSAVLKLNELGGVSATACIQAGSAVGTSDVVLSLKRTPAVKADIQADNYVLRYTGPYQLQGSLGLEGAWRQGERIGFTAGYSGNVGSYGSRQLGIAANVPITPGGLGVVGGLNWADYRSLEEYAADQYTGFYTSAIIGLNQVLWRRPDSGLSVRLIGSLNHYEDSVFNAITYDNRTSAVGRLSLLGDLQDRMLGSASPAYNAAQLTLSYGELSRPDQYSRYFPGDGGTIGKANFTINRLQTFASLPRFSLGLQGQFQLAFSNLNVAEELSLGWPNGVRAYPPGEALGDSGLVGQLTARYELLPDRRRPGDRRRLTLKAFLDGGVVWRWQNSLQGAFYPLQLSLWGPGVGLEWGRERDYSVSIDVAWPMGQNGARQNGLDVDGLNPDTRVWVGVRKWL